MSLSVLAPHVAPSTGGEGESLAVAFVNMMPDGAFLHAEQQFLGLVAAVAGRLDVEASLYAARGVPRGTEVAAEIAHRYLPLSALPERAAPGALIVTGAAPTADELEAEAFYPEVRALVRYATASVACTMLSCLAAHAALHELDRIVRVPLAEKLTGVFSESTPASSQLALDLTRELAMPHSRWNDVPPEDLLSAGYEVIAEGPKTGWSIATARREASELLLLQGHPEYDASSLLREYRRDASRFTSGDSMTPPPLPTACVAPEDEATLARYHDAVASGVPVAQLPPLDFDALGARAPWPWRPAAITIWTAFVARAAGGFFERPGTLRSFGLAGG